MTCSSKGNSTNLLEAIKTSLRLAYSININVVHDPSLNKYSFTITSIGDIGKTSLGYFNTYEDCLEQAISQTPPLIKILAKITKP